MESMNRRRFTDIDPDRVAFFVCVGIALFVIGMWAGEGNHERKRQEMVKAGLYNPQPPQPRPYVDCGIEAKRICQSQRNMARTKA